MTATAAVNGRMVWTFRERRLMCEEGLGKYRHYSEHCTECRFSMVDRLICTIIDEESMHCRIEKNLKYDHVSENANDVNCVPLMEIIPVGISCVYGHNTEERVYTSVSEFDFSFTSNDSDIEIFSPHVDSLLALCNIAEIHALRVKLLDINCGHSHKKSKSTIAQKLAADRTEALQETHNIKMLIKENLFRTLGGGRAFRNRYTNKLTDTLANVIVQHNVIPYIPVADDNQKTNPHVSRRKKKGVGENTCPR
jgi:hypothetical protein